jgi:Gpi18-like mannosyltransferase
MGAGAGPCLAPAGVQGSAPAIILILICALCAPISARAETNLAKNGDLANGSGSAPNDWYALSSDKKLTTFSWTKTPGDGGVLGINNNLNQNFASWHQALILSPGVYEISAEVRVEGAQPLGSGANLAIQTYDGIRLISKHLHGTTEWQRLSFFLREDRWGDTTQLLCQLGIAGFPDTGNASFRNIKVIALANSPQGRVLGYNLASIRQQYKDQVRQPDTRLYLRVIGIAAGLALLALLGFALFAIWQPALMTGRSGWVIATAAMLTITAIKFAALFHFTGFYWDIWAKTNRALLAVTLGPSQIYDPGLPVDAYPPGSLYLLWFSGWLGRLLQPSADGFRVIVETPPLIADLLIGLTLYFAAWRDGRTTRALIVMLLFALNPALIFDTVVWGQSDSVVALPMIVAAILILFRSDQLGYRLGKMLGWSAAAIAILAKPQAITLAVPLGLWTLLEAGIAECGWCALAFIATIAIGILPYQIGHPWYWITNVYQDLGTRFSDASVGAFNFMGLIGGMGSPDTDKVLGVSYWALGMSLTGAVYLISSYLIYRTKSANQAILATFVALFGFFMFAPRIHERYLYYPVIFLIPIALESGILTTLFTAISATFLFNLVYIKHLTDTSSYFPDHPNAALVTTATTNLIIFVAATAYGLLRNPSSSPPLQAATTDPKDSAENSDSASA